MAKKSRGQMYIEQGKRGTSFGIRFRLPDGRRVYEKLGQDYGENPIDRREAEVRAERLLAQVALGQFRTKAERAADEAARAAAVESPPFAIFAEEWLERRRVLGGRKGKGLSKSGEADLRWRLDHLGAWFGGLTLAEVTEEEVERFATAKRAAAVGEGGLGGTSVNKVLSTLEAIFDVAVRYRRVERNPVAGYRVPATKYVAAHLDTTAQMVALLEAADARDKRGRLRRGHGRPLLATLLFGRLRIDEALSLAWRDVDLAAGTLRVRDGKTENAARTIYLLPSLRDELDELKARRGGGRDDLLFATTKGNKDSRSNVGSRIFAKAVTAANERLENDEEELIPEALTMHGLRHTHISVMFVLGEEAGYVADQVGHADAGFTYSRYRKRIKRRDGEPERLRALFQI